MSTTLTTPIKVTKTSSGFGAVPTDTEDLTKPKVVYGATTPELSEPPAESQALAVPESKQIVYSPPQVMTPTEARNESVAHMLDAAYARASTLQLTPEESKALTAEFPDTDILSGARGKDHLLYLEHAAVRRRMMEVFGPGQWTIINRRSWLDESGGWLYADIVLVCRGCFIGESVGAARYSAQNKTTNYADAVKGAESDALGRIAGTALGVGLQLWSKTWCDGWHQRHRNAPQSPPANQRPYAMQPERQYQERTAATTAQVLPSKEASPKTQEYMWNALVAEFGPDITWAFLAGKGWVVAESNDYSTWTLATVPTSKQALAALAEEIRKTLPESKPVVDSDGVLPPEFGSQIITVPRRGQKRDDYLKSPDTIQSLYSAMKGGDQEAQRRLFGMARGWTPEPYVDGSGKKRPIKQEDSECRIALDQFLDYIDKKGKTQGT